jgi:hypothetical protein
MLSCIIRFSTYHFTTPDSPVLFVVLVTSTLEYVSLTWHDFTLADSNLLEHIQLIASSCSTRLILSDLPPIIIQFWTLEHSFPDNMSMFHFLLTCSVTKLTVVLSCPYCWSRRIHYLPIFSTESGSSFSPPAMCSSTANSTCIIKHVFNKNTISRKDTFYFLLNFLLLCS